MNRRKLIPQKTLKEALYLYSVRSPLNHILELLDLDMSQQTLKTLLVDYKLAKLHLPPEIIAGSFFPPWLNSDGQTVQQQPIAVEFIGLFPEGVWKQKYRE